MRRPRGAPPSSLVVEAAAKVNIGWRVGPRRADGYHEVCGLIQTVSLTDRLDIEVTDEVEGDTLVELEGARVALSVTGGECSPELSSDENLVLRAAASLARSIEPLPTRITLHKRIPVAAGLGGGSADAAAALIGLSMAWRGRASGPGLLRLAAELGSDVPAVLLGGLVAVSGRGESVRAVGSGSRYALVLGVPDARLSTRDVYARFDEIGGGAGSELHHNDLQRAAISLEPAVVDGLESMRSAGAVPVFVSGSGPVVVGVAASADDASGIAGSLRSSFRAVHVVEPVSRGVSLRLAVGKSPPPG